MLSYKDTTSPFFLSNEFVVRREMLEEEVKRRRAELLKKFRLDSDRIPIRSDFEKKAPAKAAVKIPEPPNFGKSTAAAPPPPISNPASAVEVVSNMWQTLTSDTIKVDIDKKNESKITLGFGLHVFFYKDFHYNSTSSV